LENPQQQIEIRIRLQKVAEICKEERGMARVNCLQRFAKRRGKWQLAREKLLQRFPKRTGVCLAREKKIQRFPKRTERELGQFCKPLRRGQRERKSYIDSAQTYKSLQKGQRGGYVHSAKTYKSLQRRQRGLH
jgi:hypothetical protein